MKCNRFLTVSAVTGSFQSDKSSDFWGTCKASRRADVKIHQLAAMLVFRGSINTVSMLKAALQQAPNNRFRDIHSSSVCYELWPSASYIPISQYPDIPFVAFVTASHHEQTEKCWFKLSWRARLILHNSKFLRITTPFSPDWFEVESL